MEQIGKTWITYLNRVTLHLFAHSIDIFGQLSLCLECWETLVQWRPSPNARLFRTCKLMWYNQHWHILPFPWGTLPGSVGDFLEAHSSCVQLHSDMSCVTSWTGLNEQFKRRLRVHHDTFTFILNAIEDPNFVSLCLLRCGLRLLVLLGWNFFFTQQLLAF